MLVQNLEMNPPDVSEIKACQVSVTSVLLGETSPCAFPHRNGLWQPGASGEKGRVLYPYLTPEREHFLMTVSLLVSGGPPGVNKGLT